MKLLPNSTISHFVKKLNNGKQNGTPRGRFGEAAGSLWVVLREKAEIDGRRAKRNYKEAKGALECFQRRGVRGAPDLKGGRILATRQERVHATAGPTFPMPSSASIVYDMLATIYPENTKVNSQMEPNDSPNELKTKSTK